MSAASMQKETVQRKPLWRRLLPVAVLVGLFAAFFGFGLNDYVSLQSLKENREVLQDFVAENLVLAIAIYIAIYALAVAISIPGASIFTITGGFLFGSITGTFYTVLAATLGATIVFLIARSAFGDALRSRAGGNIDKMLAGFNENAFNYLLVLRLVPLFPFFVVNIAPAFANVRLRTYVGATLLGIVPGTFVYAQVGTGLGSLFDQGGALSIGNVLTPEILVAMLGMAALSLIPVVYKRIRAKRVNRS